MTIYADYRRDRVGWFFGLAGWQVVVVALTLLPPVWALNQQRWLLLLACLAAGATGYLLKESAPDALLPALRTVLDGGLVLGPRVATAALSGTRQRIRSPFDLLSPRELQHVGLLAAGLSGGQIADALNVTEKTVRNQMAAILSKLGVSDRVRLALLARDAGLHEQ